MNIMYPKNLDDYLGQDTIKFLLRVAMNASIRLKKPLPHILLEGNPGLGKTALANAIAGEMGAKFHQVLGLNIKSQQELLQVLTPLSDPPIIDYCSETGKPRFNMNGFIPDIMFIDEIHGLKRDIEETFYLIMDEFQFEFRENGSESKRGWVPPFTLIGATTLEGNLTPPFLRRFGLKFRLENYGIEQLTELILKYCNKNKINISKKGAIAIAQRCRGSASYAITYTLRCRDYAITFREDGKITEKMANDNFKYMRIDPIGLQQVDYKILSVLMESGGTMGVSPLTSIVGIDKNTYERNVEPYLTQSGLIARTPRGRMITTRGMSILGIEVINTSNNMMRVGS